MRLAVVLVLFFVARDAPARSLAAPRMGTESALLAVGRAVRGAAWAAELPAIEVAGLSARASSLLRLYAPDGAIDEDARAAFERLASTESERRPLAVRVEQLVFKAAYHFGGPRVVLVSGWRANAGRHGTGEAVDFKLDGVRPERLAAYLRELPRVGVGVYTHPSTQYVHLDVRESSYHWVDASPPGVKWREARLRDPQGAKRDASWASEADLP